MDIQGWIFRGDLKKSRNLIAASCCFANSLILAFVRFRDGGGIAGNGDVTPHRFRGARQRIATLAGASRVPPLPTATARPPIAMPKAASNARRNNARISDC